MIDLRKYARRLQDALGKKNAAEENCADRIDEELWKGVMVELDNVSIECAKELQQETDMVYKKPARENKPAYDLGFEKAPPTGVLALGLIINYWLGWINREKGHNNPPLDASDRLRKAISEGQALSERGESP
jgi:hypothetical protein